MRQILFSLVMLVVVGIAACSNSNNRDGVNQHDRMRNNNYDTSIDSLKKDSLDSLITPMPIMPMM